MAAPKKLASGHWRVQVRMAGYPAESATFRTRAEAVVWRDRRTTELRQMRRGIAPDKTLDALLNRYLDEVTPTKRGAGQEFYRIKRIKRFLPCDKLLTSVYRADIADFKHKRMASGVGAATILKELSVLNHAFNKAINDWQWAHENPCKGVERPKSPHHRERVIGDDEVAHVCSALHFSDDVRVVSMGQQVAVAFLLALETGMRAGEICRIKWADVKGQYIHVPITKTNQPRDVALTVRAEFLLKKMQGVNSPEVFAFTPPTLDAYFRKAKRLAGFDGFTFHDARHTAATRLAPMMPMLALCKMFGWSNPKQAMTYYNPTADDMVQLVRAKRFV